MDQCGDPSQACVRLGTRPNGPPRAAHNVVHKENPEERRHEFQEQPRSLFVNVLSR